VLRALKKSSIKFKKLSYGKTGLFWEKTFSRKKKKQREENDFDKNAVAFCTQSVHFYLVNACFLYIEVIE